MQSGAGPPTPILEPWPYSATFERASGASFAHLPGILPRICYVAGISSFFDGSWGRCTQKLTISCSPAGQWPPSKAENRQLDGINRNAAPAGANTHGERVEMGHRAMRLGRASPMILLDNAITREYMPRNASRWRWAAVRARGRKSMYSKIAGISKTIVKN